MNRIDAGSAATTVLYVEDEPVNAMLMQLLFRQRPALRLVLAGNGQEALAAFTTTRPRLLLLDLHLPDCHGADLLRLLRLQPGGHDVPAVAVTAQTRFDIAGTDFIEVWRKPMQMRPTLERLDALLAAPAAEQAPGLAEPVYWPAPTGLGPPPR